MWQGEPNPVCGSNGLTYRDTCSLYDADCKSETEITVAYERECEKRPCAACVIINSSPVCGTNGKTYR